MIKDIGSCLGLSIKEVCLVFGISELIWVGAHCGFVMLCYFDNQVYYLPPLREELIYAGPIAAWVTSIACSTLLLVYSVMSASRLVLKQGLTICAIFHGVCIVSWIVYGIHFALQLRNFAMFILPGTHIASVTVNSGAGSATKAAATGAIIASNTAMDIVYTNLPFPINLAYICGIRIWITCTFLCVLPLMVYGAGLVFALAFREIVNRGGDGTELVGSNDIMFFYGLDEEERWAVSGGLTRLVDLKREYGYEGPEDDAYYEREGEDIQVYEEDWQGGQGWASGHPGLGATGHMDAHTELY